VKRGVSVDRYGVATLIVDNIKRRPLRAVIAVLSIAVALGGAMTMVGTSESIERTLEKGYASRRVDLMVMQAGKSNPMTSRISEALVDDLERIEGILGIQALLVDSLLLESDHSVFVYGWPPGYPETRYRKGTDSVELEHGQLLIGHTASSLNQLMPGDEIELNFGKYKIVDFFEAGNVFESGVLFMRLDDLQKLTSSLGRVTFFFVELEPGLKEQSRRRIIGDIEALSPVLKVVTTEEFLNQNQLTAAVRGLGRVILFTNALLSILIISTIMVLTVSERRKELAILRAMGWSAIRVSTLVILETSVLSATAAVLGGVVGWVGLEIALAHLQTMGIFSRSILTVEHLLWLSASAVAIATLGAALPVYYTLNISVNEALRE